MPVGARRPPRHRVGDLLRFVSDRGLVPQRHRGGSHPDLRPARIPESQGRRRRRSDHRTGALAALGSPARDARLGRCRSGHLGRAGPRHRGRPEPHLRGAGSRRRGAGRERPRHDLELPHPPVQGRPDRGRRLAGDPPEQPHPPQPGGVSDAGRRGGGRRGSGDHAGRQPHPQRPRSGSGSGALRKGVADRQPALELPAGPRGGGPDRRGDPDRRRLPRRGVQRELGPRGLRRGLDRRREPGPARRRRPSGSCSLATTSATS